MCKLLKIVSVFASTFFASLYCKQHCAGFSQWPMPICGNSNLISQFFCHFCYAACPGDIPLEVGNTARTASTISDNNSTQLPFTELHSFPAIEHLHHDEVSKSWELNYREAAIFLEEGINNDKLTSHPQCHEALPAYLVVHNKWYYLLDLVASLILILLAFTEKPANPLFRVLSLFVHSEQNVFN